MNLFVLLFSMAFAGPAPNMLPGEIYARCYDRFVRAPISLTDPTYLAVKNGTKTATVACMELLQKGNLRSVNSQLEIANPNDPIARKVFQNLHMVHNSWFESRTFSQATVESLNVHDIEQPALYYTRSLFRPSTSVREVLTLSGSLSGVRRPPLGAPVVNHYQAIFPARPDPLFVFGYENLTTPSAAHGFTVANDQQVQAGDLVGIRPAPSIVQNSFFARLNSGERRGPSILADRNNTQLSNQLIARSKQPENINQHFGGGILGSPVFIMQNTNLERNNVAYKEYMNHRRLAARIFETLLCHQLPTLTDSDVATISGSPHAFENSKSCMQCHASLDPLARAYKDIVIHQSHRNSDRTKPVIMSAMKLGSDLTGTAPANFDWAMKPIDSNLYYRSLKDTNPSIKPANFAVSSIQDLGNKLSDPTTNLGFDFYSCTTKRYYEFLTGVNVEMRPRSQENPVTVYHRSLVLNLANQLRTHGSLATLIEDIIKSAPFRMRNSYSEEVAP